MNFRKPSISSKAMIFTISARLVCHIFCEKCIFIIFASSVSHFVRQFTQLKEPCCPEILQCDHKNIENLNKYLGTIFVMKSDGLRVQMEKLTGLKLNAEKLDLMAAVYTDTYGFCLRVFPPWLYLQQR